MFCRLCLCTSGHTRYVDIFDKRLNYQEHLINLIEDISTIQIKPTERAFRYVCGVCCFKITKMFQFRTHVNVHNKSLLEKYGSSLSAAPKNLAEIDSLCTTPDYSYSSDMKLPKHSSTEEVIQFINNTFRMCLQVQESPPSTAVSEPAPKKLNFINIRKVPNKNHVTVIYNNVSEFSSHSSKNKSLTTNGPIIIKNTVIKKATAPPENDRGRPSIDSSIRSNTIVVSKKGICSISSISSLPSKVKKRRIVEPEPEEFDEPIAEVTVTAPKRRLHCSTPDLKPAPKQTPEVDVPKKRKIVEPEESDEPIAEVTVTAPKRRLPCSTPDLNPAPKQIPDVEVPKAVSQPCDTNDDDASLDSAPRSDCGVNSESSNGRSRSNSLDFDLSERLDHTDSEMFNNDDEPQTNENQDDHSEEEESEIMTRPTRGEDVFICHFCNKMFSTKSGMLTHARKHLWCKLCKRKFKAFYEVRSHKCVQDIIANQPTIALTRVDEEKQLVQQFEESFTYYFENYLKIPYPFKKEEEDSDDDVKITGYIPPQKQTPASGSHQPAVIATIIPKVRFSAKGSPVRNYFGITEQMLQHTLFQKHQIKKSTTTQTILPNERSIIYTSTNLIILLDMVQLLSNFRIPVHLSASDSISVKIQQNKEKPKEKQMFNWSSLPVKGFINRSMQIPDPTEIPSPKQTKPPMQQSSILIRAMEQPSIQPPPMAQPSVQLPPMQQPSIQQAPMQQPPIQLPRMQQPSIQQALMQQQQPSIQQVPLQQPPLQPSPVQYYVSQPIQTIPSTGVVIFTQNQQNIPQNNQNQIIAPPNYGVITKVTPVTPTNIAPSSSASSSGPTQPIHQPLIKVKSLQQLTMWK